MRVSFFLVSDDLHLPVLYLKHTSGLLHATMLKETKIYTINNEQVVKLKNSNENEPEIIVNVNMTPNANGWKLASDHGLYIKLD